MAVDWDTELLAPIMDVFGEGQAGRPDTLPTYKPVGGIPFPLPGAVYDAQYRRVVDLGDGAVESSYHPVLGVRDSLFNGSKPKQGDQVHIPSVDQLYAIFDVQADGHGHTLLILMEAE